MIKLKIKEWVKRYLPSEIVGTIAAVGAASIAHLYFENLIFVAYLAALAEAIGFYSTVLIQHLVTVYKSNRAVNKAFQFSDFTKIIVTVVLEFGPAGIIDGWVLRPFFMYLFPVLLENFTLGIFVGKIVGDITFYFLVIIGYEIMKIKKNRSD